MKKIAFRVLNSSRTRALTSFNDSHNKTFEEAYLLLFSFVPLKKLY